MVHVIKLCSKTIYYDFARNSYRFVNIGKSKFMQFPVQFVTVISTQSSSTSENFA